LVVTLLALSASQVTTNAEGGANPAAAALGGPPRQANGSPTANGP